MRIKSVQAPKETHHHCTCREVVAPVKQRESKCVPLVDVHQDAASQILRKHGGNHVPTSSLAVWSLLCPFPHLTAPESSFKLSSDLDSRSLPLSQD